MQKQARFWSNDSQKLEKLRRTKMRVKAHLKCMLKYSKAHAKVYETEKL